MKIFVILSLSFLWISPMLHAQHQPGQVMDQVLKAGSQVFASHCSACHSSISDGRATIPSFDILAGFSSKAIFNSLETGKMQVQAGGLNREEKEAVSQFITKRPISNHRFSKEAFIPFDLDETASWVSGWGGDLEGTGFSRNSSIHSKNVNSLSVKWVFGFPDNAEVRSKPAIIGDWLIVGSQTGEVYAIHKQTGKIGWIFQSDTAIRGAISIADHKGELLAVFADYSTNTYAIKVKDGTLKWKTRVGTHSHSAVTGSVAIYDSQVLVPLTSYEVISSMDPEYPCCTSSGGIVSVNLDNGNIDWTYSVIDEEPKISGTKSNGLPFYGPSGAIVWGSPTIDVERGLVYLGTGENYTAPATKSSDAIQAVDLRTGKLRWNFQATEKDTWNLACPGEPNCPEEEGPDLDFGMAPILVKGGYNGKDILLAGQKSAVIHALDPDTGKVYWQRRVGKGGFLGGIHWGMATDGMYVYATNSDNQYALDLRDKDQAPQPGIFKLDVETGSILWHTPLPNCTDSTICFRANSAAPLLLPDLLFAGDIDGYIRAYDLETGEIIWEVDTKMNYKTTNGIDGEGGSIDGPSPVVSGNMLFVNSGYGRWGQKAGNVLIAFGLDE